MSTQLRRGLRRGFVRSLVQAPTSRTRLTRQSNLSNYFRAFSAAPKPPVQAAEASTTTSSSKSSKASATSEATQKAEEQSAGANVEDVKIGVETVGAENTRTLTIADVLSTRGDNSDKRSQFEDWESIASNKTVHDAINLMVKRKMGSLIVTEEDGGIVGIVTERDVLRKISPRSILKDETPVKQIMTSQITCIHESTTIIDALATMSEENVRHLAVINEEEARKAIKRDIVPKEAMRCVLSIKDIIKAYYRFESEENEAELVEEEEKQKAPKGKKIKDKTAAKEETKEESKEEASASKEETDVKEEAAESDEPIITALTLVKKKNQTVKMILNTRLDDGVTVADAVESMARNNFGAVLVVDEKQQVLGIFTERDYLTKVLNKKRDPEKLEMIDVATTDLSLLLSHDPLAKIWKMAATKYFRHYPVVSKAQEEGHELVGLLSIKDLVKELTKDHDASRGFRLMDFFKSKMESKKEEPKVEEQTDVKAEEPVVPVAESDDVEQDKEVQVDPAKKKAARQKQTEE